MTTHSSTLAWRIPPTEEPGRLQSMGSLRVRHDCVTNFHLGFPGGSDGKESACIAGDLGSIRGLKRSPGGGHGNPLQYYCLENPTDRGAWQATVQSVAQRWTRPKQLSSSSSTESKIK